MIRRPPRSTPLYSSAASDVYKRQYIITATDAFSKWAFARPCNSIRTVEVIKFMEECILSIHGKPQVIITDRGAQFTSHEWKLWVTKLGIIHNLTTPRHPQSNGIDERLNGTLARILRPYVDQYQTNWDEQLKWALYVYNTTVHESTGYSPYQLIHGCLLYTSPSPRDGLLSRMPSSA